MRGHRAAAVAALSSALCPHAHATTLDELKGYSIEVTATVTMVNSGSTCDRRVPCSAEGTANSRIYVGLSGDIFTYRSVDAGSASERTQDVTQADKATTTTRGRMVAWTMEGGNLTKIDRQMEGFFVSTIRVDPSRSTCTFASTMQPDPATHRVVRQWVHGWVTELVSYTVKSYTCSIKKGNIFATDQ